MRTLLYGLAMAASCAMAQTPTPLTPAPAAAGSAPATTTVPATAVVPTWSLKPLPPALRAIEPGEAVPLSVTLSGVAAVSGLRANAVELIEQGTKQVYGAGRLVLCKTREPCGGEPFNLEGAGAVSVWLTRRESAANEPAFWVMRPGKYDGVVTLSSNDKPLGESVNLAIHVTSWQWQLAGFLLMIAGIGLALYFTTFIRQRLTRDQMLAPAVALRADIDQLNRLLGALTPRSLTPNIDAKVVDLDKALSDVELEKHGLPPRVPLPWPGPGAASSADTFKRRIEALGAWVGTLQRVANDGVAKLFLLQQDAAATAPLTLAQTAAFDTALRGLDAIGQSTEPPAAAVLPALVAAQLAVFTAALPAVQAAAVAAAAAIAGGVHATTRSPQALQARIAVTSALAWGFVAVVTALAGAYILILSNNGFGTRLDLLACLLWGLGLPAGTLLASTTTSSVATTFNVTR